MHEIIKRSIVGFFLIGLLYFLYAYTSPTFISCFVLILFMGTVGIEGTALKINRYVLFYPTIPCVLFIILNESTYRILFPLLFLIIFCFDSAAYIVGNFLGKHPLSRISPKKTWEGVFGGIVITLIVVYYWYPFKHLSFTSLIAIVVPLTIAAICGDLFESFLKRRAHRKDSGTILGPHGGILDRFDGILGGTIVLYFFRNYLITLIT